MLANSKHIPKVRYQHYANLSKVIAVSGGVDRPPRLTFHVSASSPFFFACFFVLHSLNFPDFTFFMTNSIFVFIIQSFGEIFFILAITFLISKNFLVPCSSIFHGNLFLHYGCKTLSVFEDTN